MKKIIEVRGLTSSRFDSICKKHGYFVYSELSNPVECVETACIYELLKETLDSHFRMKISVDTEFLYTLAFDIKKYSDVCDSVIEIMSLLVSNLKYEFYEVEI